MRQAALRLCTTLGKGLRAPGRGLTQGSENPEKQRVLHMREACSPIHVNHVRDKLREIVGVSTNWRDHVKAMEERKLLQSFLAQSQKGLPPRRMKDSYIEVLLPLGSQPELREKYLTVQNTIRFGRILEDLDSLGGTGIILVFLNRYPGISQISKELWFFLMGNAHSACSFPMTSDSFSWYLLFSSAEQHMNTSFLFDYTLHGNEFCPVLDATFVMVARDSENQGPAFVNPLILESPEEEELFRQGELNKGRRVAFSSTSLLKMAPSAEERTTIHEMFLSTLDPKTISFRSRVLPPHAVWMEDSKLKSLEICHPQERNIFNRVFGGFLMRKAYELGWATACNFGGSRPFVVAVDDIMFQKPVEVGSLLFLSSQVCFTRDNYIQVRVHSEVASLANKEHMTTNVFHFTFMSEKEVPLVFPRTYGESMLYLDGQRHFNSMSVLANLRKDYVVEP
ncbi:acyl-coenzyme A thioesterase 9, mitochondrial [Puma concolor]|uniref:Acyl-coenzyme A thioesterase 9, mitochondrial n=1 Tax=Puma concolor TaxID=9696 RepID=A0A6P6IR70_PUMCO|nr:acyl-coenzyme A thioesterase 9, mitochondrial [Puma concolor]